MAKQPAIENVAGLPQLFERWMAAALPGPIPAEQNATCDRCAMLPAAPGEQEEGFFFSPVTKCCTYLPEVANFLVGAVLADHDAASAAGRATVEARIAKGIGVSPLGLHRTEVFSLLYRTSPASFGMAETMRCPHYLDEGGGRCGIWRHRESTCVTWFCKYGRGSKGRTFWQRLHDTLVVAEDALKTHCVVELGLDAHQLATLYPPHALTSATARHRGIEASDVDGRVDRAVYDAFWGKWRGREGELFLACAEIVKPLGWADILPLGGARLRLLTGLLVESYRTLVSEEVPARVRHRQLKVVYASPEKVELVGYSNIDPLRMPKELLDYMHHFDGRPTERVLDEIDRQHGVRIAPNVVKKLVDFELLSEVNAPSGGSRR